MRANPQPDLLAGGDRKRQGRRCLAIRFRLELDTNFIAIRRVQLEQVGPILGFGGDFHHAGFECIDNEPVSVTDF